MPFPPFSPPPPSLSTFLSNFRVFQGCGNSSAAAIYPPFIFHRNGEGVGLCPLATVYLPVSTGPQKSPVDPKPHSADGLSLPVRLLPPVALRPHPGDSYHRIGLQRRLGYYQEPGSYSRPRHTHPGDSYHLIGLLSPLGLLSPAGLLLPVAPRPHPGDFYHRIGLQRRLGYYQEPGSYSRPRHTHPGDSYHLIGLLSALGLLPPAGLLLPVAPRPHPGDSYQPMGLLPASGPLPRTGLLPPAFSVASSV